jgi:hypothetical protein
MPSKNESQQHLTPDEREERFLLAELDNLAWQTRQKEAALREVRNRMGTNKHDKNSAFCAAGRKP